MQSCPDVDHSGSVSDKKFLGRWRGTDDVPKHFGFRVTRYWRLQYSHQALGCKLNYAAINTHETLSESQFYCPEIHGRHGRFPNSALRFHRSAQCPDCAEFLSIIDLEVYDQSLIRPSYAVLDGLV